MTEPLLSPEQVAERVSLSRKSVYAAIRRGELPASRLAGRLRVRIEDLDAWIVAARVEPVEPAGPPDPFPWTSPGGVRKMAP